MLTNAFKTKKAAKRAGYYYLQAWADSTAQRCVEYSSGGKAELVIKATDFDQMEDMLEHLCEHYFDDNKDYKIDELNLMVKRPK